MDDFEIILNNPYLNPTSNPDNINFRQLFGTAITDLSPRAREIVATIGGPIIYTHEHEHIEGGTVELFIFFDRGDDFFQFNKYTRAEFEFGAGGVQGNPNQYTQAIFREEDLTLILDITRDWQRAAQNN